MPATFWNGWQLWEKMCFILGCAIVLVICGGCVKLIFNHYRLRKHTQLAAEKAQIRKQLERTASVNHGSGKDVPFGVRALESGIEVDGVWISGPNTPAGNTPVHTAPASPTLAAMTEVPKNAFQGKISPDRVSLSSQTARIEMLTQAHGHDVDHRSGSLPGNGGLSYQPRRSSGLRFSNSNDMYSNDLGDRDAAFAALEGRTVGFGPAEEVHEAHRRSKSWATTSWNESYDPTNESSQAASNRTLLHPSHHLSNRLGGFPNRSKSPDLEDQNEKVIMQDTNGMSEAYVPSRIRAPMSYEDLPDESAYQNGLNYENESSSSDTSDAFVTPTKIDTYSGVQDTEIQRVGFSQEAVNFHERSIEKPDSTIQNILPENTLVQYPHEMIEQPRRSQVIRKINSGFEILRPGTLGQWRQSTEIVLGSTIVAVEQDSKREPRKLHRRRGDPNLAKA